MYNKLHPLVEASKGICRVVSLNCIQDCKTAGTSTIANKTVVPVDDRVDDDFAEDNVHDADSTSTTIDDVELVFDSEDSELMATPANNADDGWIHTGLRTKTKRATCS